MTITVKFFAILRDKAAVSQTTLELPASSSVADAMKSIARQYTDVEPLLARIACAVNEHYVPVTTELHNGDELALIPPVSGG